MYKCEICNKEFSRKYDLKRHINRKIKCTNTNNVQQTNNENEIVFNNNKNKTDDDLVITINTLPNVDKRVAKRCQTLP